MLSLASSVSLVVVGYRYTPVAVDGGWASYGGFAVSQDREPYLHQASLEDQRGTAGVKSIFIFDTVSNTRALYSSLWFRIVGPGWRATKALAILELIVLVAFAGLFFRKLLPTPELALIATALLATDKMIVLMAATTFRPDVAQAALACLLYLVLCKARPTLPGTLAVTVLAALAGMFSATAVTPVAVASVFRGAELLLGEDDDRLRRLGQLGLVVLIAAGCYLFRQSIFPVLLGSSRTVLEPAEATTRIAEAWSGGLPSLVLKETTRWGGYLVGSNLPLLAALVLGAVAWILPAAPEARPKVRTAGVWIAVAAVTGILLVLDPHPRQQHLAPAMPFLLLLLGRVNDVEEDLRRPVMGALAAFVVFSGFLGFAMARRVAADAQAVGYSNAWLQQTLGELTETDSEVVVAGGTEFWSFWDQSADVTIVDVARTPETIRLLDPALERLDYAVLSQDYQPEAWISLVRQTYGIELRVLVDKQPYVVITDGFGGRANASGSGAEPRP